MKKSRILALIAAVMLLVTIVFSYSFVIQNVHHDCIGEECTICMELAIVTQTISGLKVIPALSFSLAVLCVFTHFFTVILEHGCIKSTLITLKVELLD